MDYTAASILLDAETILFYFSGYVLRTFSYEWVQIFIECRNDCNLYKAYFLFKSAIFPKTNVVSSRTIIPFGSKGNKVTLIGMVESMWNLDSRFSLQGGVCIMPTCNTKAVYMT